MTDPDGLRVFDLEMAAIKNPDGDFFNYKFKRLDTFDPVPKVSFVYGYNDWEWIIGAGIYLDDINSFILSTKKEHQAVLFKKVVYIFLLFIILLIVFLAISIYLSGFIKKEFAVFTSFFHEKPDEDSFIEHQKLHVEEFKGLAHSANIMIKQRRIVEKLLKKERDKAHNYLNVAGVIILALDIKGNITLINKKGCNTIGYSEEEIIGKNWFNNFIPLTDKKKISTSFFDVVYEKNTEGFKNDETKIITRTGQERLISWKNTLIKDENGTIIGSLSSGMDITENKLVEESFIESEKKYRLLFEKTNDPVLIIGTDDTFINCNDAAVKILGLESKDDLVGMPPSKLSPIKQPDGKLSILKANEMLMKARKNGFHRFEWLHNDSKNNDLFIDVSLTVIPISGVDYLYVVWRNISEQIKQGQELLIAKEKAEQSDNIKTSFLHNMQHEIRTPLNAIMGFAQLLKLPGLEKIDSDEYHDAIINSGHQLSSIIDKIIDFARLQSGYILITNNTIELRKFLNDIYVKFHNPSMQKSIEFVINSNNSDASSLVKTDVKKVSDIIVHLLDNAFKFTEKGRVELSFDIQKQDIIFQVTDTGVGIDKKHFDSIFGQFNRLTHKNPEKLYGGNGLGLSISKAVLSYLGGDIWVESQVGKGSSFYFKVPYRPVDNSQLIKSGNLSAKKITILSNQPSRVKELTRIVKKSGADVTLVKNGIKAIELCQNNYKTDLMIIDLDMVEMNGITATKAIRAFNKDLPIIAYIDSNSNSFPKESALLAGCSNFILNTDNENQVVVTISMFLIDNINLLPK